MDSLVSVIVPCHNAEKTIEKCISSLSAQTYDNYEIIAVDDGSTDGTSALLDHISKTATKLVVLKQANQGVSEARNAGLRAAKGEYISFVDSDDYVDPCFLEEMVRTIKGNDIALCRYTMHRNEGQSVPAINTRDDVIREMMVPQEDIAAFVWNRLYKRSIILDHDLCFEKTVRVCEDTLFNFRYMEHAEKAGICGKRLYHYIINPSGAMFGKSFNPDKITANKAYDYMLAKSLGKEYRKWVEVAAMQFNLILKRQLFKYRYQADAKDLASINRMLGLNAKAFMSAPITVKYKLAYPFWRVR